MRYIGAQISERLDQIWNDYILTDPYAQHISSVPRECSTEAMVIYKKYPDVFFSVLESIADLMPYSPILTDFLCKPTSRNGFLLATVYRVQRIVLRTIPNSVTIEMPEDTQSFFIEAFHINPQDYL